MSQSPRERRALPLSDEQIEQLADKLADEVAERAYARFTAFVGRSVLRNIMIWGLVLFVGGYVTLTGKWTEVLRVVGLR